MPFTIDDLKAHIDVEHSHAAFIADFSGLPQAAQSGAIRLLASADGLEVFDFDVEEEWDEAQMERMELLGHLCERIEIPGPAGMLAKLAAREMIAAGQNGDITNTEGANAYVEERTDLLDAARAIAALNSSPPAEPKTRSGEVLVNALARMGASSFPLAGGDPQGE